MCSQLLRLCPLSSFRQKLMERSARTILQPQIEKKHLQCTWKLYNPLALDKETMGTILAILVATRLSMRYATQVCCHLIFVCAIGAATKAIWCDNALIWIENLQSKQKGKVQHKSTHNFINRSLHLMEYPFLMFIRKWLITLRICSIHLM